MTENQIAESLKANELKLSGWRYFSHYFIVGFFFLITLSFPVFYLVDILKGTAKEFNKIWFLILIFPIIPFSIALLYYKIQRNKLKLNSIRANITKEAIVNLVNKLSKEMQWSITSTTEKTIEVKSSPSFWSGSWGELITIIIDKNNVFVNSICDPDKRVSVTSYGRNKKNTERLIEEIKKASG